MSIVPQVGGSHYAAELQHWDVMEKHDIEYLLATASKYVIRWRNKGGVEDLRKALSYVQRKMRESLVIRRFAGRADLDILGTQYNLDFTEKEILLCLHSQHMGNLNRAEVQLQKLIEYHSVPKADANDRQS